MTQEFEQFARAEIPRLLRYATALSGDPDYAHDIVQDVLARAFARWHRVGAVERPGAYLMRMVTNEFVSWRRRWATRSITPVGDLVDLDDRSPASPRQDHGDNVADRLDLERRLAALPRRQQAALVLRFFQGLDYAESAEVLDCAEGTVRSAVSRGLAALRVDGTIPDHPAAAPAFRTTRTAQAATRSESPR